MSITGVKSLETLPVFILCGPQRSGVKPQCFFSGLEIIFLILVAVCIISHSDEDNFDGYSEVSTFLVVEFLLCLVPFWVQLFSLQPKKITNSKQWYLEGPIFG